MISRRTTTHLSGGLFAGTLIGVLLERFRAEVVGLIPPEARVLVGYSGGPDSTCMLHLLNRCGIDMVAAHLHHGQRSEADTELTLAEAFCETLSIPFLAGRADVPRMSQDFGISLEEAGRRARYAFFEQAAHRMECNLIATAHTIDDHVETVIFNLTRGSGMGGLRGIPQRRGIIIRPLLAFSRAESKAYCEEHGLWTHDDPANTDLTYSRARIRLRVIPELEKVNIELRRSVARFAEIVGEEDDFLDSAAAANLEQSLTPLNGPLEFLTQRDEVAFDRNRFGDSPRVLALRGIRLAAASLGAETERSHVVRIWEGICSGEPGSETLPGGQVVGEWNSTKFMLRRIEEIEPFRYGLTVPGDTVADVFGWQITVYPSKGGSHPRSAENLEVACDAQCLNGSLYFRSAKEGERFTPLGMKEPKLISDLLQERRLTQLARRRLPIVCDMVGPIWIPGVAIAERVKVQDSTRQLMNLKFGPILGEHAHND